MVIKIILVGKTDRSEIASLFDDYLGRLKHYTRLEVIVIPDLKNRKSLSDDQQKTEEGRLILKQIENSDAIVLLDECGQMMSSTEFASYLQKKMNGGIRQLVFIIGGPYGFSDEVYAIAREKFSLSKLTFSHQMVRVFFAEQLYRAFTILRGESYHHR